MRLNCVHPLGLSPGGQALGSFANVPNTSSPWNSKIATSTMRFGFAAARTFQAVFLAVASNAFQVPRQDRAQILHVRPSISRRPVKSERTQLSVVELPVIGRMHRMPDRTAYAPFVNRTRMYGAANDGSRSYVPKSQSNDRFRTCATGFPSTPVVSL